MICVYMAIYVSRDVVEAVIYAAGSSVSCKSKARTIITGDNANLEPEEDIWKGEDIDLLRMSLGTWEPEARLCGWGWGGPVPVPGVSGR